MKRTPQFFFFDALGNVEVELYPRHKVFVEGTLNVLHQLGYEVERPEDIDEWREVRARCG